MKSSQHLTQRQLKVINNMGDHMIPGNAEMPSFSQTNCVLEVDRLLNYMNPTDLKDLKLLFTLLSGLPRFCTIMLIFWLEWTATARGPWGFFRTMRLGLRGLVLTLYYAHPTVLKTIDYHVQVYTADLVAEPLKKTPAVTPVSFNTADNLTV